MSEPSNPPGWVNWPSNLPKCATGWSEKDADPRVHTEMSVGRPKTRRRGTGITRKVNVTFEVPGPRSGTPEEVKLFKTFFETPGNPAAHTGGTDGGYHFFKFTSPLDELEHYYRFAKDGAPQMSPQGPMVWTVSMVWEEFD